MDSADLKERRQDLEQRVVKAFAARPTMHKAGPALDDLDELNRQMAADAASIKSALTCSTPGHDFRKCFDCQARLARIREVMRG